MISPYPLPLACTKMKLLMKCSNLTQAQATRLESPISRTHQVTTQVKAQAKEFFPIRKIPGLGSKSEKRKSLCVLFIAETREDKEVTNSFLLWNARSVFLKRRCYMPAPELD